MSQYEQPEYDLPEPVDPKLGVPATSDPYVLEPLTDQEAYLYAILSDPSGLDQAEFLWFSQDSDDGCFRAWDYQWVWWRTMDRFQIDQCARSVGKSLSIKVRGCAFPLLWPGEEMLITAPELIHLEPIVGLIETQMFSTWFLKELMPRGRGAVTHRPFQMDFLNGSRIIGRIPQRDGKGVKGVHPVWLELDEAQDYPKQGWKELTETLKKGVPGSRWRAHGVTRGVHDDFYEKTQEDPDNHWKVHRYPAMWRPTWTDEERDDAIQEYGSRDDPDYRRNVLGLHGDATNPIFVITTLMRNVDQEPASLYNTDEFYYEVVKSEELESRQENIDNFIDFPGGHLAYIGDPEHRKSVVSGKRKAKAIFWVGMDVGFTIDPSEILVFVEYRPEKGPNQPRPKNSETVFKLLTRLSLWRMPIEQQAIAILKVIDFYRPAGFAMDRNGNGSGMWQLISGYHQAFKNDKLDEIPAYLHGYDISKAVSTIKGYAFGEKLLIGLDETIEVKPREDPIEKAGLRREAKDFSTDKLRELVDSQRLWFPWDKEFITQFSGATWTNNVGRVDQYGRRQYSRGNDHCLDAARNAALAWTLDGLEDLIGKPKRRPVYDSFVGV